MRNRRSLLRRLSSAILGGIVLLGSLGLSPGERALVAEDQDLASGFVLWFNRDGKTGLRSGQQGRYPVWALSDMGPKTNRLVVESETYYTVQGTMNPKLQNGQNPNGRAPEQGAAIRVQAPADGTLSCYGINGPGKPFYVVEAGEGEERVIYTSSELRDGPVTVAVKKGLSYSFFAQGSKYQFAGFVFAPPKQKTKIRLELEGRELLTSATLSLRNLDTGAIQDVAAVVDLLELETGYRYKFAIDDPGLYLEGEDLDLRGQLPELIRLRIVQAPSHRVQGAIRGLPEGVLPEALSFHDAAGRSYRAQIEGGRYWLDLPNGDYTAQAQVSAGDYSVYDHVALRGLGAEPVDNDVHFYGPGPDYPHGYRPELQVGANGDYPSLREALEAVRAMERQPGQRVRLVLANQRFEEQVLVDLPEISLEAAPGAQPEISWYYGIGYKYYSIGEDGYYSLKAAQDRYQKGYAARWGAACRILPEARDFIARGIHFRNSFNQELTSAELADGVELGSAEEYGQGISDSLEERRSEQQDVRSLQATERAAALACEGDRAAFYDCRITSSQDSLYTGSARSYFRNCRIEGQTDYIFGNTGTRALFDQCQLVWVGYSTETKPGYITASRGRYVFRGCRIEAGTQNWEAGYLGRPWGPQAEVCFLATELGEGSLRAEGWAPMSDLEAQDVQFQEYGNYWAPGPPQKERYYYSNLARSRADFRLSQDLAQRLAGPAVSGEVFGDWSPQALVPRFSLEGLEDWPVEGEEQVWQFRYFGPSTGAETNRCEAPDSIAGTVRLYSCTYDEQSGAIQKKGGKFVSDAPADGLSFYYTEIDPSRQNFRLQADVHLDYLNPKPDGQEGFALLCRDSLRGSGSFLSNSVATIGSKLPYGEGEEKKEIKDLVGLRNFRGVADPEDMAKNQLGVLRQGFNPDFARLEQGRSYRLRLEKRADAYVSSLLDPETGSVLASALDYIAAKDSGVQKIQDYRDLADPLAQQEPERAYLGLAVARGVNASFSNIQLEIQPFKPEDWKPQPDHRIPVSYEILSPTSSGRADYQLQFRANADGQLSLREAAGQPQEYRVKAGEICSLPQNLKLGENTFHLRFIPDQNYRPGPHEVLADYSAWERDWTVTYRVLGDGQGRVHVRPDGRSENSAVSYAQAVDLPTALSFAAPGQRLLLQPGSYNCSGKKLVIPRGISGEETAPIQLMADPELGGYAVLDFGKTGQGLTVWGDWWEIQNLAVTRTADGYKGLQLAGHHNLLDRCVFFNNGSTGCQISGSSQEARETWPSHNLVRNCTSMNNADRAMEDADGFAAKLTTGEGNVFTACIAAYNADDGWDLFAKAGTGSIGAVTIRDSLCYRNGYLLVGPRAKVPEQFRERRWDEVPSPRSEDRELELELADFLLSPEGDLRPSGRLGAELRLLVAGNGNGFKLGGTNLPGGHQIVNSISYENKAKGFDANSCPDIQVQDCTAYNNGSYNLALYTNNKQAQTAYRLGGLLSFRKLGPGVENIGEQIQLQGQDLDSLLGTTNYCWDEAGQCSRNSQGDQLQAEDFQSLDTRLRPSRRADGSIDMQGLLLLRAGAVDREAGARGAFWLRAEEPEQPRPTEQPQPTEQPSQVEPSQVEPSQVEPSAPTETGRTEDVVLQPQPGLGQPSKTGQSFARPSALPRTGEAESGFPAGLSLGLALLAGQLARRRRRRRVDSLADQTGGV